MGKATQAIVGAGYDIIGNGLPDALARAPMQAVHPSRGHD